MGIIKKLSDETIAKIAAGEVIERPAFAIKELIENAIDAKAKRIKIDITDSGLRKISVTDDGVGMSSEDLLLSFMPHTTSKLNNEEELVGIKSLGFRGEALSSIASVSTLTIISKSNSQKVGTKIVIKSSRLKITSPIGAPSGTQVIIESLFALIPARKKFLKSKTREYRLILDTIINASLSSLDIEFEFIHNNKPILFLPLNQSFEERLSDVFSEAIAMHFILLKYEDSYLKIKGVISRPQINFSSNTKIYIFVNGRRIYDSLLIAAIKEAYGNLLESKSFPFSVIYLTLPYEIVDVNIHPRKEQVSFTDQKFVYEGVNSAVKQTLENNNLNFYNIPWKNASTSSYAAKLLKEEILADVGKIKKSASIIQLHNLYLITETKKGIMLIDQHACHEAILFRKLVSAFEKHKKNTQKIELNPPVILNLGLSDKQLLIDNLAQLNKLGFEIDEFGDGSLLVTHAPLLFQDRDVADLIEEVLTDLAANKNLKTIDNKSYQMLAFLACRSAIKGGDKLSKKQMKDLLDQLSEVDMLYTCPHGRPVKIEFSLNQIAKIFKRR